MRRIIFLTFVLTGAISYTGGVYAGAVQDMAIQASEPAPDPKRKKAGDECKSSEECQKHHSCKPSGEKSFCTVPPAPKLPPGVVT